jgi:hypothetical protein
MMKTAYAITGLVLLAYVALVAINVPPLVKSNHVSVNWSLLGISGLGLLLAAVFIAMSVILWRRRCVRGRHVAILLAEAVVLTGISSIFIFKALTFFGVV